MSNLFEPGNRDQQANHPTEQFWPQAGGQACPGGQAREGGNPGHGGNAGGWGAAGAAPQPRPPGFSDHVARDRRKASLWAAGVLAAVLLVGGGVIAGITLTGHSAPSGGASLSAAAGPTGQAAQLNTTLSSAGAPGALAPGAAASGTLAGSRLGAARPCSRARRLARAARLAGFPRLARAARLAAVRCRLARHRVFRFFLLRGVDGQFTFQTPNGLKTLAYERGVIQSITAGSSIVVKAADGTTWTWDLVSTTVVRDQAGKVAQSALSAGEPVWVGGPAVQGAKDARLIVIRPPALGLPAAPAPAN